MMIKQNLSPATIRWLAVAGIAAVMGLVAVSCQTVRRQAVILPDVPGAKYIGSAECELCHDEIYRDFATADHARLVTSGPNALPAGCESCHGLCRAATLEPATSVLRPLCALKPLQENGSGSPRLLSRLAA